MLHWKKALFSTVGVLCPLFTLFENLAPILNYLQQRGKDKMEVIRPDNSSVRPPATILKTAAFYQESRVNTLNDIQSPNIIFSQHNQLFCESLSRESSSFFFQPIWSSIWSSSFCCSLSISVSEICTISVFWDIIHKLSL